MVGNEAGQGTAKGDLGSDACSILTLRSVAHFSNWSPVGTSDLPPSWPHLLVLHEIWFYLDELNVTLFVSVNCASKNYSIRV